ncbi:translation regulator Cya5 [Aspergillus sclerotialis]|uniref:Translation regulator Cya5 n=1 Tax=Aspergillus sclerotialis TaxID=2070753 RepID=A0A3A2ZS31_9EURO|nr:translation regulator Cya5 [Aspergillus sclerotialis]
MLERASGRLESAGRRFFRDSNGVIRSRRPLNPQFWRSSGAITDLTSCLVPLLQQPDQRTLYTQCTASTADQVTRSSRTTVLDFLYPPKAQEFAVSCLLRPPRRPIPRRKKVSPSSGRSYATRPRIPYQDADEDLSPSYPTGRPKEDALQKDARDSLQALLALKGERDYNEAWRLYCAAGYPRHLISDLLGYLCHSKKPFDHGKSKRLFETLSIKDRTHVEYLYMTISYANANNLPDMRRTMQQALEKHIGSPSWGFAFAQFLNRQLFVEALELWYMRPKSLKKGWIDRVAPYLDASTLPHTMVNLATLIKYRKISGPAREFLPRLLEHISASSSFAENIGSQTLLHLLRIYMDLGLLKPEHNFKLIETLVASETRATFIKSMVVYRNFRWQTPDEKPPVVLLRRMMRKLVLFEITNGIRFLLDEIAHFYGKALKPDYRRALNGFANAGDVQQVNEVFDLLVRDHGKELSRKLLTPLLYVHARVGNVRDTLIQFKRVKEEFNREQNTVCWNILLTAYSNSDDLTGTLATFDQMLKSGVELDSYSFGILMGLCANRGDIENVLRVLSLAKERNVQISTPLLDPIVEAYCKNGLLDMAEQVAEACLGLDTGGSPVRMWNLLLLNYAFRIDLESVSRIRTRMEMAGIQPDGVTYAAFMLSLVLMGQTDSARRILRTLHRSRRINAAEFHYAIILYGYLKARNRDMVHIIFKEIKQRFDRPGFNSRLLSLRSKIDRDMLAIKRGPRESDAANQRLEHAEKFLMETIGDSDVRLLATKEPSLGIGKQPHREAFPSMYYEYVINAYGTLGASRRAEELFDEFTHINRQFHGSTDIDALPPLRLLSALMLSQLNSGDFDGVEECWKKAFPKALKMAMRVDITECLAPQPSGPGAGATLPQPEPSSSDYSMAESPQTQNAGERTVLPSWRFFLSRPLSLYMRSLAYRGETWRIPEVITAFEKTGFAMTTFNWSTYIQLLSSSDQFSDQINAFLHFEKKFMPNFPGWQHLRRSRGVKPPGAPKDSNAVEKRKAPPHLFGSVAKRLWSNIQPDFMQPTYITMVYLASAMLTIRQRSLDTDNTEIKAVYDAAPKTIDAIAAMPMLREKYQGSLLRGNHPQRDPNLDREQLQPFVWTGGVLGVDGRTRSAASVNRLITQQIEEVESSPEVESLVEAGTEQETSVRSSQHSDKDIREEDLLAPSEKTIDPQDRYDMETELDLSTQRRDYGFIDEPMDIEPPKVPYRMDHRRLLERASANMTGEGQEYEYYPEQYTHWGGYSGHSEQDAQEFQDSDYPEEGTELHEYLQFPGDGSQESEYPQYPEQDALGYQHSEYPEHFAQGNEYVQYPEQDAQLHEYPQYREQDAQDEYPDYQEQDAQGHEYSELPEEDGLGNGNLESSQR